MALPCHSITQLGAVTKLKGQCKPGLNYPSPYFPLHCTSSNLVSSKGLEVVSSI